MTITDLRRTRGLLIDTNLLILLVVGRLSPDQISTYKRTKQYSANDYQILLSFIEPFRVVITTPNILTEASNLLEGYQYRGVNALLVLQGIATGMQEIFQDSLSTMSVCSKSYTKFGLSDATIHRIAQENFLVLTDDLNFCAYLQNQKLIALNFNNLRTDHLLH